MEIKKVEYIVTLKPDFFMPKTTIRRQFCGSLENIIDDKFFFKLNGGGANGTSVDPKNIMQIMMMSEMMKGSGSGDNKMMAFMAMSMMGNNPFAGLMNAMNPIAPITTTPAVMTTSVQTAVPAEAATADNKNTTV